ncbi:hypothetical protein PENSPDRAFT_749500 [Peniophora sp. CONT]|nr:hypothetical protein PENSPDRAFT_749500 [Peniophora sp. CONT]
MAKKSKTTKSEEDSQKKPGRLERKILDCMDPNDSPSWMWYPGRLRAIPQKVELQAGTEEDTAQPASADVAAMPTPAAISETSATHAEAATEMAMHVAPHAQHHIALKSVTLLSSSTPTLSAQAESGPSNGPESPRKTMVKRKRSEAEVGRDDAAKRPKTSKGEVAKPVSKAAQENEGGKAKKVAKTRAKGKGKGKESEVDSAEGASVPCVPYSIAEPGSKVKEGYIRLPARARRAQVASE